MRKIVYRYADSHNGERGRALLLFSSLQGKDKKERHSDFVFLD